METDNITAIHMEAIEVFLNHILYVRRIYPAHIFKKQRVYNTPVFIAAFPGLNSYISNVLKTVQELLETHCKQLKFEVIIYSNEGKDHVESYIFKLKPVHCELYKSDQYLMEYEQQLSAALYKLPERVKQFPDLENKYNFKVHIHTTQSAFTQLSYNAQYQEFPWLQAAENAQQFKQHKILLLPLVTIDKLGLQMNAHIFTKFSYKSINCNI